MAKAEFPLAAVAITAVVAGVAGAGIGWMLGKPKTTAAGFVPCFGPPGFCDQQIREDNNYGMPTRFDPNFANPGQRYGLVPRRV